MEKNKFQNTFVDSVRRFASVHDLLVSGGKYIVALSGGADSVALLLVLKQLQADMPIAIEAAHCNFHLRGEESMRDERFCISLCKRLDVPLHLVHFATREYSQLHHVSIEMAARELRYKYFEDLRRDLGANDVCVAHHRDDSVETVLLNLVRGTGLRGLRGIQPRNANIIRPLLCVSRNDILDFLAAQGQDYVTDSSNLEDDVKRNKIRLNVIPVLKTLNQSVQQSIFDTSLRMGEALRVFESAIEESVSRVSTLVDGNTLVIDIDSLRNQPSPEYTLFHILEARAFTPQQIELVYSSIGADTGKMFSSPTHELLFNRGRIVVKPKSGEDYTWKMRIPEPGTYVFDESRKFSIVDESVCDDYEISRRSDCVCLDASCVEFPLTIRHLEEGDRFVPFGMKGSKLVSDYLTDRKRTVFEKRSQLVVTSAGGSIVWLVGERSDERCRITQHTKHALRIRLVMKSD